MTNLTGKILVTIIVTLLRGLTTKVLWSWFLVPLGVPVVSLPLAMGVSGLVSYMTKQINPHGSQPKFSQIVEVEVVWSLVSLTAGWIIYLFI